MAIRLTELIPVNVSMDAKRRWVFEEKRIEYPANENCSLIVEIEFRGRKKNKAKKARNAGKNYMCNRIHGPNSLHSLLVNKKHLIVSPENEWRMKVTRRAIQVVERKKH